MELRFNEPLFNEVLDITKDTLRPHQNHSKMYGIEPRYNEFLDITNIMRKPKRNITRRLAACTQAVVILRSTSYIAIELNVLNFKSYEIQSNRCAQVFLPLSAFFLSFADL